MISENNFPQCAKKVVSNSPGIGDFPDGLVDSVHQLPDGQVKFLGKVLRKFKLQIVRDELFGASDNDFRASVS